MPKVNLQTTQDESDQEPVRLSKIKYLNEEIEKILREKFSVAENSRPGINIVSIYKPKFLSDEKPCLFRVDFRFTNHKIVEIQFNGIPTQRTFKLSIEVVDEIKKICKDEFGVIDLEVKGNIKYL